MNLTPNATEPKSATVDVPGLIAQIRGTDVAIVGQPSNLFTGPATLTVVANNGTEASTPLNISVKAGATYEELMAELGAVGYWPMDEESGTTIRNAMGTGGNGVLTPGPGLAYRAPAIRKGSVGSLGVGAVTVQNHNQINVVDNALLNRVFGQGKSGSIVMWIRNQAGNQAAPMMAPNASWGQMRVSVAGTTVQWPSGSNAFNISIAGSGYYVIVRDVVAQEYRYWSHNQHPTDPLVTKPSPFYDPAITQDAPLMFNVSERFQSRSIIGAISDFAIFDKALSNAEVTRIIGFKL